MTEFVVVIPARYASTRLPGKALLDIHGKPMLQHVYERGVESQATEVVIATDDERIATAAEAFGATVCMTSADHQSGTERIAEVADVLDWPDEQIVVNLQGDEPAMPAAGVRVRSARSRHDAYRGGFALLAAAGGVSGDPRGARGFERRTERCAS